MADGFSGMGMLPSAGYMPPGATAPGYGNVPSATAGGMGPAGITPPLPAGGVTGAPGMPGAIPMAGGVPPMGMPPGMPAGMPGQAGMGGFSPLAAVLAGLGGGAVGPRAPSATQLPAAQQAAALGQGMGAGGGGLSPQSALAQLMVGSVT
jgi:hypothetical protein